MFESNAMLIIFNCFQYQYSICFPNKTKYFTPTVWWQTEWLTAELMSEPKIVTPVASGAISFHVCEIEFRNQSSIKIWSSYQNFSIDFKKFVWSLLSLGLGLGHFYSTSTSHYSKHNFPITKQEIQQAL